MPEGTIKRLTDRGFGFINTGTEKDLFFHSSSVQGSSFDDLKEGQKVSYTEGKGPKDDLRDAEDYQRIKSAADDGQNQGGHDRPTNF